MDGYYRKSIIDILPKDGKYKCGGLEKITVKRGCCEASKNGFF